MGLKYLRQLRPLLSRLGVTRASLGSLSESVAIFRSRAMIVCMLILIHTDEKPNRAMHQMARYSLIGTRGWGSPKRPRFDGSPKRKRGNAFLPRLRFGLPLWGKRGVAPTVEPA